MAGLYLHIPFCEHKCIYCDFYSVAPKEHPDAYRALINRFLLSLHREIKLRADDHRFRTSYKTIFFGGGTPSLLSASNMNEILNMLNSSFSIADGAEVTLETNPGTVDEQKLRDFRQAGVNRISFGVQSFHDDDLKFLTRIHSASQAKEALKSARRAGFENLSIDLMFSLPNQSLGRWESNLEQAMELDPAHISCYSLIIEPNTPLARMVESKQIAPLPGEQDAELYEFTMEFLSAHGYEQYEVSNFAKPGFRSQHNSGYWNHDHYLGFGPSAHSFWDARRWWNVSNVVEYSQRLEHDVLPVSGEEQLVTEQLIEEEIFLGLRGDGIDTTEFTRKYRLEFLTSFSQIIVELVAERLAMFVGPRLKLTSKGYLLCDEICSSFLKARAISPAAA
jgi:oxygen-independent coproporphyrinogen III oxidase